MTAESLGWLAPAPGLGRGRRRPGEQRAAPAVPDRAHQRPVRDRVPRRASLAPPRQISPRWRPDDRRRHRFRSLPPLPAAQPALLPGDAHPWYAAGSASRTAPCTARRASGPRSCCACSPPTAANRPGSRPRPPSPGTRPAARGTHCPGQLTAGEEQLPMHAAPVAGFAQPGTTAAAFGMSEPGRRTVHYGYIPTSRRERLVTALTPDQAVQALQLVDPQGQEDPTLSSLWTRVILPWGVLKGKLPPSPPPGPPPSGTNTDYSSLYVLLDLSDWLNTYLPSVYDALIGNTTLPSNTPAEDLRAALADVSVFTSGAQGEPHTSISTRYSGTPPPSPPLSPGPTSTDRPRATTWSTRPPSDTWLRIRHWADPLRPGQPGLPDAGRAEPVPRAAVAAGRAQGHDQGRSGPAAVPATVPTPTSSVPYSSTIPACRCSAHPADLPAGPGPGRRRARPQDPHRPAGHLQPAPVQTGRRHRDAAQPAARSGPR